MSRIPSATFIPRSQRMQALGRAAAERARAAGAKALDQFEAHIAATFGPAARHNEIKVAIDRAMARGACDIDVRARYMKVALLLPTTFPPAIQTINRAYLA